MRLGIQTEIKNMVMVQMQQLALKLCFSGCHGDTRPTIGIKGTYIKYLH